MITFFVSGLWHGAAWHYVVWGLLNGAFQVFGDIKNRLVSAVNKKRALAGNASPAAAEPAFSARFGQTLLTLLLVCFTWVFFRAESLTAALEILRLIFTQAAPWAFTDGSLYAYGLSAVQFWAMLACVGVLVFVDVMHERGHKLRRALMRQQLWFRWCVYLLGLLAVLLLGVYGPAYEASAFIYFQF